MIGGGNSALEEGIYLTEFADHATFVTRGREFDADPIYVEKLEMIAYTTEAPKVAAVRLHSTPQLRGHTTTRLEGWFGFGRAFGCSLVLRHEPCATVKLPLDFLIEERPESRCRCERCRHVGGHVAVVVGGGTTTDLPALNHRHGLLTAFRHQSRCETRRPGANNSDGTALYAPDSQLRSTSSSSCSSSVSAPDRVGGS